jgi:cysteine synthase/rhodanese-related sulfurtransferase
MSSSHKNIFSGKNAVLDFLNPDKNLPLPLVELPEKLNPLHKEGVRIYAKLLNMLPLSNVKSLPAFNMLNESHKKGRLNGVKNLVESSSGNTVLSLAAIARLMGVERTMAFASNEVNGGKLQMLRIFGVDVTVNDEPICPDPSDEKSGINKAIRLGKKKGWFNPGQYHNQENPESHERWTARQVWEQLEGDIQVFCAGLGTAGTMTGCANFFKKKKNHVRTVGVVRTPNNQIPGVRTRGLLNMTSFEWEKCTDYLEEVGAKESFEKSLELIRHGLVVGPSSGFALAGLLKHLESMKKQNRLGELRNKKGEINSVFICCDSPLPYLDEYFAHLDDSYFPKVENEELLPEIDNGKNLESEGLNPEEAYEMIYPIGKDNLWNLIKNKSAINVNKEVAVIDIRSKKEFDHFHIAGSENIEFGKIAFGIEKTAKAIKGKKAIIVCNLGIKSDSISKLLRKKGVEAYSLKGGITEWSNLDLPRWKPDDCFRN